MQQDRPAIILSALALAVAMLLLWASAGLCGQIAADSGVEIGLTI